MGFIAIVGTGALGGALARTLATRDRVPEVRLIDSAGPLAQGKALDILQSGPIEGFSTRLTAADSIGAAAGADVIVIADAAATNAEHAGETGLALVRQVAAVVGPTPLLFAGATQRELIDRAITELHVPRMRILGSAPLALESAVRALAALWLDISGADVSLCIAGVPPRGTVVAWEEATASGLPLTAQIPAHAIAALTSRLPGLWPPGPYALASAAAHVIEAIVRGSRRRLSCFVPLDRTVGPAGVAAMPVELGKEGVRRILEPALTRQERTMLENAIGG